MKRYALIIIACLTTPTFAAETLVKSNISSVGLFKNGLAVVKRTVPIDGNGTYRIEDVPTPVHGTFWIESNAVVETRVTSREVDVPIRPANAADFQSELVGRNVLIHFRDGRIPPVRGMVHRIAKTSGDDAWNRSYGPSRSGTNSNDRQFMVLKTKTGHTYVSSSMIAYVQTVGKATTVKKRMPVLLLTVTKAPKQAQVQISYLAKGMAWAPSYRIDISNKKELTLEQKAVIKNELGPINNTEINLISGFPGIRFGNVTSPLSHRTTLAAFFQQLNRHTSAGQSGVLGNVMSQQAVAFNSVAPSSSRTDISAKPSGEGVDLHFQSIGRRTLKEGDSLSLNLSKKSAKYERIVDWMIPDTRNTYGTYVQSYYRQQSPGKFQNSVWDAIRFKNPLSYPMTTGAAMITSNGQFNGQNISYFVNSGENTTVRITKSLSIRTHHVENEERGQRDVIYIGGRRFREVKVSGRLRVSNHRNERVSMVIRRRFSGDLIEATDRPKTELLEEGAYSINKRNQLVWDLKLGPGQEKKLTYRYTVLVAH